MSFHVRTCTQRSERKVAKELGPGLPHITVYLLSPSVRQTRLQYAAATSCSGPLLVVNAPFTPKASLRSQASRKPAGVLALSDDRENQPFILAS